MNLKVRFKNPLFWLTVIPALVTFIYTLLGCFGVVPTISEDTVINIVTSIISALTTLGVLIDPTTKGLKDSQRAMDYDAPYTDDEVK